MYIMFILSIPIFNWIFFKYFYFPKRSKLFGVHILLQRCGEINCNVYACLINCEKAFERAKLWQNDEYT